MSAINFISLFCIFIGYKIGGFITIADLGVLTFLLYYGTANIDNSSNSYKIAYSIIINGLVILLSGSFNINDTEQYIKEFIKWMGYVLSALLIADFNSQYNNKYNFELFFIRISTIIASLAIIQYAFLYYNGQNIFSFISSYAGVDENVKSYIRASGLFQHYNQLAVGLIPGLILSFAKNKKLCAAIITIGIFTSGSRSGMGSCLLIFILTAIQRGTLKTKILFASVLAAFFTSITETDFVQKRLIFLVAGEIDGSTQTRLDLIESGIQLFKNSPIFGIGIGQLQSWIGEDNLENGILLILVETGIFGFIAFTYTVIKSLKSCENEYKYYRLILILVLINSFFQPFLMMSGIAQIFLIFLFMPILSKQNAEFTPTHLTKP